MKVLVILLVGIIVLASAAISIQSIYADHEQKNGEGIFKDENRFNIVRLGDGDSKYQIHLLIEVRTTDGQLISVSEASHSEIKYLDHETTIKITERLGEKEIITVDGTKFQKIQYVQPLDTEQLMSGKEIAQFTGLWRLQACGEVEGHGYTCVPIFQATSSSVFITPDNVVTNQWTILSEFD